MRVNKNRLFWIQRLNPLWWASLFLVLAYRLITKPFPSRCRFYPTCSTYARDALYEYGWCKSMGLIALRIGKCHPFHPGGVDFVKKNAP